MFSQYIKVIIDYFRVSNDKIKTLIDQLDTKEKTLVDMMQKESTWLGNVPNVSLFVAMSDCAEMDRIGREVLIEVYKELQRKGITIDYPLSLFPGMTIGVLNELSKK